MAWNLREYKTLLLIQEYMQNENQSVQVGAALLPDKLTSQWRRAKNDTANDSQ